jgi:hypothetical protein
MEFVVKKHSKEEFYQVYNSWIENHGMPLNSVSIEVLPKNIFVCYNEEIPIYAIPFWHTDSKICIASVLISNKKINYKKRIGGKEFLLEHIIKYAKRKKYLSLFSPTKNEKFIESLLKVGFLPGDDDSSQYFKRL